MILTNELSAADFVAAWPVPPLRTNSGGLELNLEAAGLAAWSMSRVMAYAVHDVLVREGFRPPLVDDAARRCWSVLFGAADAPVSGCQMAVMVRAGASCAVSGIVMLPDVDSETWQVPPAASMVFAGVGTVVDAIGLATPIEVVERGPRW